MLGQRTKDIRGADEAEAKEELVEVRDKSFVTILECHHTMH